MNTFDFLKGIQTGLRVQPGALPNPEQMREIIHKQRWDSGIVNRVLEAGEHQGLNPIDTYTALAYYALVQLEETTKHMLDLAASMPRPSMIMKPTIGDSP